MTDDDSRRLYELLTRIAALERAGEAVLSGHESSSTRIVTLEDSYKRLGKLSIAQDDMFRESLRAVELGLYRAAHVLAWAGFIDFFHEHLAADKLSAIKAVRAKWTDLGTDAEDLREHTDFQVIEAAKVAGFYNNTVMKALHGLLNRRNECGHPSEYFPDLNEALGFVSELFKRIEYLQSKSSSTP